MKLLVSQPISQPVSLSVIGQPVSPSVSLSVSLIHQSVVTLTGKVTSA